MELTPTANITKGSCPNVLRNQQQDPSSPFTPIQKVTPDSTIPPLIPKPLNTVCLIDAVVFLPLSSFRKDPPQDNVNQGEDEYEPPARKHTSRDLAGFKVLDGLDKVIEGGAVVLTLKDHIS